MKEIPLTRGHVTIVDDADFESLSRFKWHAVVQKNWIYAARQTQRGDQKTQIYMHRQILGIPKQVRVDHVNGNGLDNQRGNLRSCTVSQNAANRKHPVRSPSGYHGVSLSQGLYWRARICVDGNCMHLGHFPTSEKAALAYDRAARHHFKEFARLNFPEVAS